MLALALFAIGCGRSEPRAGRPSSLAVNVLADSGRGERLHVTVPPPSAAVWLTRVSPARPRELEPALPVPTPAPVETAPEPPPPLIVDEGLKPPIVRHAGTLRVPPGTRRGSVDLDVRVTEEGDVSDALWAGGSADGALVAAAISCALDMRFYPALQAGRPVAVWCRQRFDVHAGTRPERVDAARGRVR